MNFNIYLDDETGSELTRAVERSGTSRNALVRQAVAGWLRTQNTVQWPAEILAFEGQSDMPSFESTRRELKGPLDDPLA